MQALVPRSRREIINACIYFRLFSCSLPNANHPPIRASAQPRDGIVMLRSRRTVRNIQRRQRGRLGGPAFASDVLPRECGKKVGPCGSRRSSRLWGVNGSAAVTQRRRHASSLPSAGARSAKTGVRSQRSGAYVNPLKHDIRLYRKATYLTRNVT